MKNKKIILTALGIMSLFNTTLYAQEELPKDKPGTAVFVMSTDQTSKVSVATDIIKEERDHLQVNLQIPVISNLASKRCQRKLNKEIKKINFV